MKRTSGRLGASFVLLSVLAGACLSEEKAETTVAPSTLSDETIPGSSEAKDVVFAVRGQLERAFGKANLDPSMLEPKRIFASKFDRVATTISDVDIISPNGVTPVLPKSVADVSLPVRADGAFKLRDERSGLSVEVGLVGAMTAPREESSGYVVYRSGYAHGAHIVHRPTSEGTEDYVFFPDKLPEVPELRYEVALGNDVAGLRLVERTIEMLDKSGVPRLRMAPPYAVDGEGRRLAVNVAIEGCAYDSSLLGPWGRPTVDPGARHCTVRLSWDSNAKAPLVVDPAWSLTGNMSVVRFRPTAVAILTPATNGGALTVPRVLVAGGDGGTPAEAHNSAELFDETTNTWAVTGSMTHARTDHTMVYPSLSVAPSANVNTVYVIGGRNANVLGSIEKYNISTGAFTAVPAAMANARWGHTASVTDNATRIFVAGGKGATGNFVGANEIYTMANGTWALASELNTGRIGHTATPIDGVPKKFMVIGGETANGPTANVEFCDVSVPSCTSYTTMQIPHVRHASIRLGDSFIAVAGGGIPESQAIEVFDLTIGQWSYLPASFSVGRSAFSTAQLIPLMPPRVVVTGGFDSNGGALKSAELFDIMGKSISTLPDMNVARAQHASAALSDGRLLVIGGAPTKQGETLHCESDAECANTQYCGNVGDNGGRCLPKKQQSAPCDMKAECWGGSCGICQGEFVCVDGFCCNSACEGQCEACDGPSPGVCSPISGAPHGERPKCVSDVDDPSAPKCGGKCDGFERLSCEWPVGRPCGQACSEAMLKSLACNEFGGCDSVILEVSCSPFQCAPDGKTCATSGCTKDMDCGPGFVCNMDSGLCVAKVGTQKCDKSEGSDEFDIVRSSIDNSVQSCGKYLCRNDACLVVCETAYDCLSGNVCTPEGKCVAPDFEDTAGTAVSCSTSSSNSSPVGWVFALAAAAAATIRRNRARV